MESIAVRDSPKCQTDTRRIHTTGQWIHKDNSLRCSIYIISKYLVILLTTKKRHQLKIENQNQHKYVLATYVFSVYPQIFVSFIIRSCITVMLLWDWHLQYLMSFFATRSSKIRLIQSVRKMFDLKLKYISSKALPKRCIYLYQTTFFFSSFILLHWKNNYSDVTVFLYGTKQYNLSERKWKLLT